MMRVWFTGFQARIAEARPSQDTLSNGSGDSMLRGHLFGILELPRLDVGLTRSLRPPTAPVAVGGTGLWTNRRQTASTAIRTRSTLPALRQRGSTGLAHASGVCYCSCASSPSLGSDFRIRIANFASSKVNTPCIIRTSRFTEGFRCTDFWTVAHFTISANSADGFASADSMMVSTGTFVIRDSLSATLAEQLRFPRNTLHRWDWEIAAMSASSSCVVPVKSIQACTLEKARLVRR